MMTARDSLFPAFASLLLAACGSPGGPSSEAVACTQGAKLASLPACTNGAANAIDVKLGCAPKVDGTYDQGEWADAACITVGNDPLYMKYSGSNLYLAWSVTPACGCAMPIAFNPKDTSAFDGSQFAIAAFDDPFNDNGDATAFTYANNAWQDSSTVPAGVVIANPPKNPNPVTYEWEIPLASLGVTPGQPHSFTMAIYHNHAANWPADVSQPPAGSLLPSSPAGWGTISSSSAWK